MSRKRLTIGLLTEMESSWEVGVSYLSELCQGVEDAAAEEGVDLLRITGGFLCQSPFDPFESQRNILYANATSEILDGIVLPATTKHFVTDEELKQLSPLFTRVPTVCIGPFPNLPTVELDNRAGLRLSMNHLIKTHGFNRIAFVRGPLGSYEANERFDEYKKILEENQIEYDPDLVTIGDFFMPTGIKAVKTLLDVRKMDFQAVLCSNDGMAIGVINELQNRNIIVPYDMPVIGFDDIPQARHIIPPLSTVKQPLREMGREAVFKVLRGIRQEEGYQGTTLLKPELVLRRSCGCKEQFLEKFDKIPVSKSLSSPELQIKKNRESILEDLRRNSGISKGVMPQWEEAFLDSFLFSLENEDSSQFLLTVDKLMRRIMTKTEESFILYKAGSILRNRILPLIKDCPKSAYFETLLHQAQLFSAEESLSVLSLNSVKWNREIVELHNIGQLLITTFNIRDLMVILEEKLPDLGIIACYLVLYEDPQTYTFPEDPPQWSNLILAFAEDGRLPLQEEGLRFPTNQLLPPHILNKAKAHTLLIEALYFRNEQIGYAIFQHGPKRRLVYEVLRGKISSAIKGALLLESHQQAEKELRKHRDHLDELVKQRSEDLIKANQGLQLEVQERKAAEKELNKLRSYLENIIHSMPSILVGVDVDGNITQWNREAAKVNGVTEEHALGQPMEKVLPFLSLEKDLLPTALESGQQQFRSHRRKQPDGNDRFEEITLYPLQGSSEQGAVIRIDDVSERIRIEEMMIQSEKMLSVGGLAAGMAHEINNPLAGMMQTAEVLSRRLTEDLPANKKAAERIGVSMEEIRQFMEDRDIPKMLKRIRDSGSRAAEIVQNMLSFARKSTAGKSSTSLEELLEKTLELASSDYNLKKRYDFRQIDISRDYEENLPLVACEGAKVQQVLLNLFRNGAEAMHDAREENAPKPAFILRTRYEKETGMVRMEISDNGPGIPEEVRKRVFEPFFTTKPTNQGTGLGLSVSYFIITQNHNGEMEVQSSPGEGTTFIIKLPACEEEA